MVLCPRKYRFPINFPKNYCGGLEKTLLTQPLPWQRTQKRIRKNFLSSSTMKKRKHCVSYTAVGVMSGTSLDGLDMALARFTETARGWKYHLIDATTVPYSPEWVTRLSEAHHHLERSLIDLHVEYGEWIGEQVKKFLDKQAVPADLIGSHGHTIIHRPEIEITVQIGDGPSIARKTGITTIYNFRHRDVSLGGQGAPLVPMGDRELFREYDACLNIGGFSNISYRKNDKRIAYDIGPANILLNKYVREHFSVPFDRNGELGRKGRPVPEMLYRLNQQIFYRQPPPKSLGREWVERNILPVINRTQATHEDILRTLYEHISDLIYFELLPFEKVLVTGGGAFNTFLVELIEEKGGRPLTLPDPLLVNYKEALVFGFLAVLRFLGRINCLASVTGAKHDNMGGFIYRV